MTTVARGDEERRIEVIEDDAQADAESGADGDRPEVDA